LSNRTGENEPKPDLKPIQTVASIEPVQTGSRTRRKPGGKTFKLFFIVIDALDKKASTFVLGKSF
jgi:hypothetical protein